jgi:hypothetical protein
MRRCNAPEISSRSSPTFRSGRRRGGRIPSRLGRVRNASFPSSFGWAACATEAGALLLGIGFVPLNGRVGARGSRSEGKSIGQQAQARFGRTVRSELASASLMGIAAWIGFVLLKTNPLPAVWIWRRSYPQKTRIGRGGIRLKNPKGSSGEALACGEIPLTTGGPGGVARDRISSDKMALR